jgi:hypothetical protein
MRIFVLASTVAAALACTGLASAQQDPSPAAAAPSGAAPAASAPPPLATTTSASAGAQNSPDLPAPEARTTTKSVVNRPVLVTSLVVLGGVYVSSAIDGALSGRDADRHNLFYPVVGPWMDLANRGCGEPGHCNANETGYKALLVLGGIGQGLGALGVVTSFFLPEKVTRNWYLIGSDTFHAAPSPVGSGYGVGAAGVF